MKYKLILLCLLFLVGCNPSPIPTTIPEIPLSTSTLTPTPKLITATPRPTYTSMPTLAPPENVSQLIDNVMEKLNSGQQIPAISAELEEQQVTLQEYSIDFNGDGIKELFFDVTFREDVSGQEWIKNIFWIASPSANGYVVGFIFYPKLFLYQGHIQELGDLNGDGLPDLVVSAGGYGNFCNENLFIFGWQNTEYVNYQTYVELCVTAFEVGENHELIITGGEGGSLGGGPPRKMEVVLTLQEGQYQPTQVTLLPSEVRIHVLEDAQIAFDAGDYALALEYWDRAAHDPTLENYPSHYIEGQDQPEIYQPAYALYRAYALYLFLGEEQNAENIFQEIATTYPQGSPGSEFIGISTKTAELFGVSHDPGYVCPELVLYIDSNTPTILTDHWVWGYYNFDIVNFCPLP